MRQIFVDLENYSNMFFVCMRVVDGDKRTQAVFNFGDHEKMAKIMQLEDVEFVSYNGQAYDFVCIAYWLSLGKDANCERMHAMNDTLISKDPLDHDVQCVDWLKENYTTLEYEKFGETRVMRFIRSGSEAAQLLNHPKRKEVDLYLLGEKTGGLKAAAIVLGVDSLVETPIPFDKPVPEELKPLVIQYCWNDVDVTEKAYAYYKETLVVRKQFEDEGIPNAACLGSAKLAEIYLLNMHEKATGKRLKRDDRPEYATKDLVSDLTTKYDYEFRTPEYARWYKMFSRATIHYQPHFLQDTFVDDGESEDDGIVLKKDLGKPSIYSVGRAFIPRGAMIIPGNGLRLKFGGGGLHNDAESGIWKKSETHMLLDIDVTSYYPSLMVANKFSPRHIPELSGYMEGLLNQRVAAKMANRTTEANSKKLVLNSSFGKTKDLHSVLCDPRCHYSVTVNGQLLLMTLIEMMYESVPGVKILNVNTDGICAYFPVEHHGRVKRVMKAWEEFSACNLETNEYEVFAQSTCNMYCARHLGKKKPKTKGADFKLEPAALKETFAKATAVKRAVVEYLLDGVDPAETIAKAPTSELIMSFTYGKKTFAVIDDVKSDRKALRYLYGKEGVKLGRTRQCDIDEGKKASVVDGGRPVILGDVLSLIDRSAVDESRYVAQAQEIIMGMLRKNVKGTGADLKRNPGKYWAEKDWRNQ